MGSGRGTTARPWDLSSTPSGPAPEALRRRAQTPFAGPATPGNAPDQGRRWRPVPGRAGAGGQAWHPVGRPGRRECPDGSFHSLLKVTGCPCAADVETAGLGNTDPSKLGAPRSEPQVRRWTQRARVGAETPATSASSQRADAKARGATSIITFYAPGAHSRAGDVGSRGKVGTGDGAHTFIPVKGRHPTRNLTVTLPSSLSG